MNDFLAWLFQVIRIPPSETGAGINTAGVLTKAERAFVDEMTALTGMSNSEVMRAGLHLLMDAKRAAEAQTEKA